MKPVTISVLKKELNDYSQQELVEICLKLARFKKENKELLTYTLFNASDEDEYINLIKEEIDEGFLNMNMDRLYFMKKSTRKILRTIKKYIRYSKQKETEAYVLLHFCFKLGELRHVYKGSQQMINIYDRQLVLAKKAISTLHEDLQYDLNMELEKLNEN